MTPLLDRLRQETRPLHEQTEQLFYTESLQNGLLSISEYGHLLRTHLLFHQSLERALATHADFFREYALQTRQKTPWLLADLTQLSGDPPTSVPDLFTNWSSIDLLGAVYVSEGSMLGGTVIYRLLQRNLSIEPTLPVASRFYQGYGTNTGSLWRQCGEFITKRGTPCASEVVAAAGEAFSQYQQAFLRSRALISQE